jgi:hyperosmotically inducible periplasmic protein
MKKSNYLCVTIASIILVLAAFGCATDQRPSAQYLEDRAVSARVKTVLADDPQVRASQVNVDTYERTVQLSGFVDSREEARRAVQLARDVDGVESVINNMVVKSSVKTAMRERREK